ncbi:MAG: STAS domain-containing protein [Gammaproteobacteria bacterium]|nr:STAS domain-containing protein [Gammaproteobacteria bacterium]
MSDKTTLTLPEQLDIAQVVSLKDRMDKALAKEVSVFELIAEKIERVDSAGMQLLLSFKNAVQEANKEFKLLKPSDEFLTAADLLGSTELLEL